MICLRFARKLLAPMLLGGVALAVVSAAAEAAAPVQASCKLQSAGNKIKRVVHLTFDNVHLRRDNPNVPSDLEQMPHLLNFLLENGTVSGNHFTPLISHTAQDIVTTLTGLYGNRFGWTVANSYGFFRPDGSVGFQSSFLYWTGKSTDGNFQMTNELGKIAPAPWVSYTRAGCDVAGFSTANIEFESIPADVTTVYGANSPEAAEAAANHNQAVADFEGIAIHCAQNSPLCAAAGVHAKPDLLPDEPGGYTGFNGIFGNKYLQPVINPTGPILDLDGNVIANVASNGTFPGFPGFSPTASQSLGYVATLLEAGVPVVYFYIADAHDNRSSQGTFGPGEAGYVAQLAAYDAAWDKFFARLAKAGITKENTLFVFTSDEDDHFVGGPPSPANCDGIHVPCTYAKIGEIDAFLDRELLTQRMNTTNFSIHSDDAPTVYIIGNPGPTDPVTRTLEKDLNALTVTSVITGNPDKLSILLADKAEMKLLHMIPFLADRVPTFTMFGNDNYFFETSSGANKGQSCASTTAAPCLVEEGPSGFAWNHGDFQKEITRTWFGMVGPGVAKQGRNDEVFSDHTDLRPTILALVGLQDDYVHDGRVLVENLKPQALPDSLEDSLSTYKALAHAYKKINATKGSVGVNSLVFANRSIISDDATYAKYLTTIGAITAERDALAQQMITLLNGAAFANQPIRRNDTVEDLIEQARKLADKVEDLANGGH
jgi:arylsulfatase A-like enzyme